MHEGPGGESNNILEFRVNIKTGTVLQKLPDLICESITLSPQNPIKGDVMGPIVVTIKNRGLLAATESVMLFGCGGTSCFPMECEGCGSCPYQSEQDLRQRFPHKRGEGEWVGWYLCCSVPSIRPGGSVQFTFRPKMPFQFEPKPRWASGPTFFASWVDVNDQVGEGYIGEHNNWKHRCIDDSNSGFCSRY